MTGNRRILTTATEQIDSKRFSISTPLI